MRFDYRRECQPFQFCYSSIAHIGSCDGDEAATPCNEMQMTLLRYRRLMRLFCRRYAVSLLVVIDIVASYSDFKISYIILQIAKRRSPLMLRGMLAIKQLPLLGRGFRHLIMMPSAAQNGSFARTWHTKTVWFSLRYETRLMLRCWEPISPLRWEEYYYAEKYDKKPTAI